MHNPILSWFKERNINITEIDLEKYAKKANKNTKLSKHKNKRLFT